MPKFNKVLNVVINGASGNIAYALLPLICNGIVFGPDTKINLRLLDLESQKSRLTGTLMEIEDGAYEHVSDVKMFFDPKEAIIGADFCIFIASYPHFPGMERKDLIKKNAEIYKNIGEIMNIYASKDCKTLVVANPVNALTTILAKNAPNIPAKNFTGLSRLDHNRAKYLLAKTCDVTMDKIKNIIVWGNHSDTQYPDLSHAKIDDKLVSEILKDKIDWMHTDYVDYCVNRWKKIVEMRGVTSIMSPANAIKDHIRNWYLGTDAGHYVSMAVISDGKKYGVPEGMCFSMPVECDNWDMNIPVFDLDEFTMNKLKTSIEEIAEELKHAEIYLN
jgi:malate dehydrogenase